jgi:hypothetical protein
MEQNSHSIQVVQSDQETQAEQYRALRKKFPYLPGETFYTLFQGFVTRWEVWRIWLNSGGDEVVVGHRDRGKKEPLESPRYLASECYPTAEACKSALPVME